MMDGTDGMNDSEPVAHDVPDNIVGAISSRTDGDTIVKEYEVIAAGTRGMAGEGESCQGSHVRWATFDIYSKISYLNVVQILYLLVS